MGVTGRTIDKLSVTETMVQTLEETKEDNSNKLSSGRLNIPFILQTSPVL